jgi:23S rRNA pseudouridine1911/1915/1917 synthase
LVEGVDGIVRSTTSRRGRRAVTLYRTVARRDYGALVECKLETGRRNQIRAHLAEIDCPILGDRKYGDRSKGRSNVHRPLLHAASVQFTHPVTGRRVYVEAPAAEPELRALP